ncbi:MAG: signal recognition particle-docking protein FtsY [Anaerolineae bacterium]|nr:signal recognition particle-docking protein FtsY [Anaerolineae bacterium]MCB0247717.1 signal recognition particle-docking protein FtsY [Anaerolineae bacterium]
MFGRLGNIFQANEITEQTWDELEETLIMGDVGIETTEVLVARVQQRVSKEGIKRPADAQAVLKQEMLAMLGGSDAMEIDEPRLLTVVLVVGVNGSGKTTSIAKLAKLYKDHGRKVVLAAADTFRAAAVHQLQIWGERVGVDVIAQGQGADPGAVVFDAIRACQETRKADLLIIDTAGRLHTKFNLMKELEKVRNVASRQVHKAPHETFLILDASTGQNALSQARHFKEAVKVTGVILTKLDGTAKGGIVFAIAQELGVPVRFVGTGERMTDIAPFDPKIFVDSLFA